MSQVSPCSGIRRSTSCLFWRINPSKLCWLFRAILRNLVPRNLFWGCSLEWHSFVAMNRYLRSPRGSQVYWVSSSVFFHAWLVSNESRSRVLVPWLLWGYKVLQGRALPYGLELSLWGPIFPELTRTWAPGGYSGGSLESFGSWLTPHKHISYWNCPMARV